MVQTGGQVLVSVACDGTTSNDLNGLLNCLDLLSTQLLAVIEIRCFLRASGCEVFKVFHISIASAGGVLNIALCISLGLHGLCLELGLLVTVAGSLGVLGIHLIFFKLSALCNKFVQELVQHLDDARGLALISVCLRRALIEELRVLLEELLN